MLVEFVNPENIYFDTKILIVGCLEVKIYQILWFSSKRGVCENLGVDEMFLHLTTLIYASQTISAHQSVYKHVK